MLTVNINRSLEAAQRPDAPFQILPNDPSLSLQESLQQIAKNKLIRLYAGNAANKSAFEA